MYQVGHCLRYNFRFHDKNILTPDSLLCSSPISVMFLTRLSQKLRRNVLTPDTKQWIRLLLIEYLRAWLTILIRLCFCMRSYWPGCTKIGESIWQKIYAVCNFASKFVTWRSCNRASWYNCKCRPTRCNYIGLFIYSYSALHVSGDVFAHHQEPVTVFTASGNVHRCCCRLSAGSNIGKHYQKL